MTVTVRELRNQGGAVLRRVGRGERLTVTSDGHPVAQLVPLPVPAPSPAGLVARWRQLPPTDLVRWRADLDAVIRADL